MNSENSPIETYQMILSSSENGIEIPMPSENPPIEERCGVEDIDTIAEGLLVLAPLDQVAKVLSQLAARWERNVYGQSIQGCGLLVFQFQGHDWMGILNGYMTDQYRDMLDGFLSDYWDWELQAHSLSQKLHTKTIYYWVDDCGCTIGYAYWENGKLMERLEFDEAIWQDTHDEALLDESDRPFEPHLFESRLRQLTAAEIEDAYAFVDNFLCEQQAYAATSWSSIQRDDFVRLDYVAFA